MERIVFVHGSVVNGRATWAAQRPLADRFELVVLDRPGFPPNPPVARVDFERDAALVCDLLRPGDHLVGHSYGGVIALLAATARPEALGSLAVIEPPATAVAAGNPAVDAFAAEGAALYASGANDDPEDFLRRFLTAVGSRFDPPSPLPADLAQGAQALQVERGPWEAKIPLATLSAARFPKLVVSGAHHPAFEAICDVLEHELPAERLELPGYGHVAPLPPAFIEALADFVANAAPAARR
jgi:pimeloyl-ACP methyl ester carboxylesterase